MRSRNEGSAREYLVRRFFCANATYAFRMCVSTSECKYALSEHVGSQNVARSSWRDMQTELIISDIWLRRDYPSPISKEREMVFRRHNNIQMHKCINERNLYIRCWLKCDAVSFKNISNDIIYDFLAWDIHLWVFFFLNTFFVL